MQLNLICAFSQNAANDEWANYSLVKKPFSHLELSSDFCEDKSLFLLATIVSKGHFHNTLCVEKAGGSELNRLEYFIRISCTTAPLSKGEP